MFNTITSSSIRRLFDLDRLLTEPECADGPIQNMIANERFIVITPGVGGEADTLAIKLLKGLIFNAMMSRDNMLAPMAYVADEFQNFITTDSVTGDQNFLDKCRVFRVSCVLVTQSVMHLKNKVMEQKPIAGRAALGSLLINLSNKIVMRTSDNDTKSELKNWLPSSPNGSGMHVVDARPLMTLGLGEYYFSRADGRWGREKVVLSPSELDRPQQWGASPTF
ncbi:hypothetical protein THIAE_05845 [Thiomicrospira aerophila AL3]|uniref:TraD/TraG TraM recognition site domain-containing protein n=1 Tax=Thiomicrospira aerophila AL3 TaxID=717772 RepID=W0DZ60_9GAMM|nr:hypothetical protein [Thiomicrospira aerophila]AHF02264.1 hypothetical protein THIAE_05845 [Thiomicrospira aerophila AL3]